MQSDPVIWNVISRNFCSFKVIMRHEKERFCRNQYNVSGLCRKSLCPLANSRYATVREENGVIYLFVKTIERAHSPRNLWEKIELNFRYTEALGQIDEHLEHWPAQQVHRVKQRLTRLHQYLLRMKSILKNPVKVTTLNKKEHRRDMVREKKALSAAKLDFAIKQELLERLKNKTYGDLYNINPEVFNEVLNEQGEDEIQFVEADEALEKELEAESMEDIEDMDASGITGDSDEDGEEEEEDEGEMEEEFEMEGESETGDHNLDLKMLQQKLLKKLKEDQQGKRKRKGEASSSKKQKKEAAHVEIEYETEPATTARTSASASNW